MKAKNHYLDNTVKWTGIPVKRAVHRKMKSLQRLNVIKLLKMNNSSGVDNTLSKLIKECTY